MVDERRSRERYRVWFPMSVIADGGAEGTAITYDVSASGLLMACPGRLEVGSKVALKFRMTPDAPERELPAKIVRVEERPDEDGPWRYRMAVQFDQPHPELEGLLAEASRDDG